MKLTIFILLFVNTLCSAQVVESYEVQVFYQGNSEVITIKNDRLLDVPPPVVEDGSILFDGEYLLNNVKRIEIKSKKLAKGGKSKTNYNVDKVSYWSEKYQRVVTVDVITFPEWEASQRKVESDRKSIFAPNQDELKPYKNPDSENIVDEKTAENIVSTSRKVYQADGNGKFWSITNGESLFHGSELNTGFAGELVKKAINTKSDEYSLLTTFNLKEGNYIIFENSNGNGETISYRITRLKFAID